MKARIDTEAVAKPEQHVGFSEFCADPSLKPSHAPTFEEMADLLPVGIFRMDALGRRIYVNECWSRIAGLPRNQANGDGWLEAIHPDDRERVKAEWQEAVRNSSGFRSEYRFHNGPGQPTWIIGHAVPEFDHTGQLCGFLGAITDITELKRAAEKRAIEHDSFCSAFGFAPHGMALVLPTGRFLQVNRFLCQMLGYSESELLQLRFQDISHADELPATLEKARGVLQNQRQVLDVEKKYIAKDGHLVWVHVRSNLVRDAARQPLFFVSHMRDITEAKEREEALRQSEERYRQLVELSKDGILIHSGGKVVFVNPAAARILGASSPDQLKNLNVIDLVHPEFRPVVQQRMRELREGARVTPFIRETLMRLDGTTIRVEVAGVPFVYAGQPSIQVIIRDISERLRGEEERDQLFHQIEEARDQLQSLSHRLVEVQELERRRIARELHDEVGQELTALRLNLEQAAGASPTAKAACEEARERVQKLLGFVRDLSLELRPTMLDDLGLVPALLWHIGRYTALSQIKVDFKHFGLEGRRFGPEIETAAYRIVQEALTNVLRHSNAKEVSIALWLSEPEPSLAPQTSMGEDNVPGQCLCLQIEDHGSGFDVGAAFRSGASSGLTGMRERASLLGGKLNVQSVPGEGTGITSELPLTPKQIITLRP